MNSPKLSSDSPCFIVNLPLSSINAASSSDSSSLFLPYPTTSVSDAATMTLLSESSPCIASKKVL